MSDSKRKTIAILLPDLNGGGAERVAIASAQDLVRRGHQVQLVLLRAEGVLLPLVPPEVEVIGLGVRRFRKALGPLTAYLKRARPDVLHAVMWPLTVLAILAQKLAGGSTKVVVSEQVALSRQNASSAAEWAAMRWSTRLLYPHAREVIACADGAADALARMSGLPRDRVQVINNPILPPAQMPRSADVEAMWGDAEERLISIGSLKPQKNQRLMIEAFARLPRPRARLMILGEGRLRGSLETLARELGVGDRVLMPGFFIDPWPFLASAHLFVMSSDWEGFPLALAEGMAAGLRIVSTDCPSGPAELTDRGRFGTLVPCGDADALAAAIDRALDAPHDPAAVQAQAEKVAGTAMIQRYSELLLSA